jgi:glyoxylase-like metal-dependent hydrolase (beta-lactamase superfamily II)
MRLWSFLLLLLTSPVGSATDVMPEALAPDLWLLRGDFVPGRQPDGNSVLLRAPGGVILIDSGRHPAHRARIEAALQALDAPLAALINTHWHLDHVGNNPALRARWPGLDVYGSDAIDAALDGFLANYRGQLDAYLAQLAPGAEREAMRAERARIDAGPALVPNVVITHSGERTIAGRRLHLGLESDAVTGGDVWLFDPATRVLVAGDLVTLPAPLLDTACAPRWQAALARLEAQPFERLVPGHGAPMDRAQFAQWRRAFDVLLVCAASDADAGTCVQQWRDAAGDLLAPWPDAQIENLTGYYVAQRLRGDGARSDCPAGSADD